jgi:hypothetical protein
MKNRYLLLAMVLICSLGAQAQLSRLIGLTKTKYNGLDFATVGDTINYMYTGAMDTTRTGGWAYDSAYNMVSGTGYTTGNLSCRTYQTFIDTFNVATTKVQSYDTPTVSWQNYQFNSSTFDALNNVTNAILQIKDPLSGGWLNSTNNTYTYAGSNETLRILQAWNTTSLAWANKEKDSFAYDASSNMTYRLVQLWDTTALDWVNNNQYFYTYNSMNQPTNTLRQNWDRINSLWVNNQNTIYDYNAATHLSNTIVQRWDTGALVWNNATADSVLYFATGDKSVETTLRWDTAAHIWANINMNEFTYDGSHNVITDTTLNWSNALIAFVYNKLRINSYNSYNQTLVTTTESWSTATSSWIYRLAGGGGPGGASDIQWRYHYELYPPIIDGVQHVAGTAGSLVTFPDPATDLLNIRLSWNEATSFTVAIYNISGSLVRQWAVPAIQNYTRAIPVSDLAPGNYIIKAGNAGQQMVQQFVKQ